MNLGEVLMNLTEALEDEDERIEDDFNSGIKNNDEPECTKDDENESVAYETNQLAGRIDSENVDSSAIRTLIGTWLQTGTIYQMIRFVLLRSIES